MLAPSPSLQKHPSIGLWSLLDMMELYAAAFIDTIRTFRALEVMVQERAKTEEGRKEISDELIAGVEGFDVITRRITDLDHSCQALGATVTCQFVAECAELLKAGRLSWGLVAHKVEEIHRVLDKELGQAKLLTLNATEGAYYENATGKFGIDVIISFPSAIAEIDEAGKCFALGRHTACVFHLMRALEVPLAAIAKILLPNDPRPNWDPILAKIDSELDLPHKDRKIKGQTDFYAGVSSHMHAVKIAWRNRVMHVDAIFPEDRAKAIFDATVGLMNHLATQISEDGEIFSEQEQLPDFSAHETAAQPS